MNIMKKKIKAISLKDIISMNRFYPNAWLTLMKYHYIGECQCDWDAKGNLLKIKGKCLTLRKE